VVNNPFQDIYETLLDYYGHQAWWPAQDEFEVMVGAILTQNTAWTNVEKAIANLKQHGLCNAESLAGIEQEALALLIRSSGYFNQKAERLRLFAAWYLDRGGWQNLSALAMDELRSRLLALKGIGEETADDMVLYAFAKPTFVIDTYTRRLFSRLELLPEKAGYGDLQQQFHDCLPADVDLFKQYHALIVTHAKRHCMKQPDCSSCPLRSNCAFHNEV